MLDDGGETSGASRYARLRAGTSRKTRGLTSCRSMTVLQPAAKMSVTRNVSAEEVVAFLLLRNDKLWSVSISLNCSTTRDLGAVYWDRRRPACHLPHNAIGRLAGEPPAVPVN